MDLTTLDRLPLWIGGRATPALTTRYGEVTNPATGEVLRHVPLSTAADVSAAVAAAVEAWPAWRAAPALRRARILMRFRDLLEQQKKDLARLVTRGARQDLERRRGLDHARHRSRRVRHRHSAPAQGRIQRQRRQRRRQFLLAPAAGRVRRHHAVQFSGHGAAVDVPDRHRLRQHVRAQALGARPQLEPAHGRTRARGGSTRRACSMSCTATRKPSTRSSTIPTSRRCRLSARRRSHAMSTRPGRRAASACRRSAARRTMRSLCPTRTSTSPPTR